MSKGGNRLNEGIRVSVECNYINRGVHKIRAGVKVKVRVRVGVRGSIQGFFAVRALEILQY